MATLISDQTFTEKPEGSETPIQVVGGCGTHSYFKNSFYQVYFLALHFFFLKWGLTVPEIVYNYNLDNPKSFLNL